MHMLYVINDPRWKGVTALGVYNMCCIDHSLPKSGSIRLWLYLLHECGLASFLGPRKNWEEGVVTLAMLPCMYWLHRAPDLIFGVGVPDQRLALVSNLKKLSSAIHDELYQTSYTCILVVFRSTVSLHGSEQLTL